MSNIEDIADELDLFAMQLSTQKGRDIDVLIFINYERECGLNDIQGIHK